jgi:drug/metabolite transporter (DMT)-like permease
MLIGIFYALLAGMLWGLVFVSPLFIPEYPGMLQSCGRYLAFGLISIPLAWLNRKALALLKISDWVEALKLAMIGNLLYYLLLATAIQYTGAPLPTLIIGMLPIVIPVFSHLMDTEKNHFIPWRKLIFSLIFILIGIFCVNHSELSELTMRTTSDISHYILGAFLAFGALICWTWYPIRNAQWLQNHKECGSHTWATAQGLASLPLSCIGYTCFLAFSTHNDYSFSSPLGPKPLIFITLMLSIGFFASWLGTLFWNKASQRVPTVIMGQLIIFETLSALLYAYLLRWQWPEPLTRFGIFSMVTGIVYAMHLLSKEKKECLEA